MREQKLPPTFNIYVDYVGKNAHQDHYEDVTTEEILEVIRLVLINIQIGDRTIEDIQITQNEPESVFDKTDGERGFLG